jgi:hypothetical protein
MKGDAMHHAAKTYVLLGKESDGEVSEPCRTARLERADGRGGDWGEVHGLARSSGIEESP